MFIQTLKYTLLLFAFLSVFTTKIKAKTFALFEQRNLIYV